MQKNYKLIVYNSFFIALGILGKFLREINIEKSLVLSGTNETSFDTLLRQKSLSLYCKQINRVKNEVDVQPICLLAHMRFSAGKATISPRHLLSLQLDTHFGTSDFKLLREKRDLIIPNMFYFYTMSILDNETRKIYPHLIPLPSQNHKSHKYIA